jgi:hypothetical protein
MTHNTLGDVGRKAMDDPDFWKALRKDVHGALAQAGYSLSPDDLRVLEEAISSNRVSMPLDEFMKTIHSNAGFQFWSGIWSGRWPFFGRWPPIP